MASTSSPGASAIIAEIRAHMGRSNVKTPELAKKINRSYDWVYRRLSGSQSPSLDDLEEICRGLPFRLSDLLKEPAA